MKNKQQSDKHVVRENVFGAKCKKSIVYRVCFANKQRQRKYKIHYIVKTKQQYLKCDSLSLSLSS